VGVQNGSPEWNQAALDAGLAVFGAGGPPGRDTTPLQEAGAVGAPAARPAAAVPAGKGAAPVTAARGGSGPAMVLREPVRGGQQITADGDLVVLAAVSPGAELAAVGHIHVYGTLRGRAFAGIEGDETALIFCDQLEAQLVSIAGAHLVSDEIDPRHLRRRARIALEQERIVIYTTP
jgi:septum site-determining protein MinC